MQVHIIAGIGDISQFLTLSPSMFGTMEGLTTHGSPNDPLFIIHHTMVDCVFDEWMKRHSCAQFPNDPSIRHGHNRHDYIVGFFPLYTNEDLFRSVEEFGYSCSLSNLSAAGNYKKILLPLLHT